MRDIDYLINFIKTSERFPPVIKQVLINRIDQEPTREELEQARLQVYPPGATP